MYVEYQVGTGNVCVPLVCTRVLEYTCTPIAILDNNSGTRVLVLATRVHVYHGSTSTRVLVLRMSTARLGILI